MEKNRFDSILKHHCDSLWEYDLRNNKIYIYHDSMFPDMRGKWHDIDSIAELYKKILFGDDDAVWQKYLSKDSLREFLNSNSENAEFELRFVFKNSEPQWYRVNIERDDDNRLIIFDKNIYKDIKESSMYKIVENVFENILYIDVDSGNYIIHYTDRAIIPYGDCPNYETMIEKLIHKCMSEDDAENLISRMKIKNVLKELEHNEKYVIYTAMRGVNDEITYKKMIFSYLDGNQKILTLVRIDVSDLVKEYVHQINRYKKERYKDALKGAYNRKYFEEKIKKQTVPAGVAIIDLDDFKICNDTFGHMCGDAVLAELVKTISGCISEKDTLIRYGGDEFLLIMPKIGEKEFEQKLKKIQMHTYNSLVPDYPEVQMSVSIGGVLNNSETNETIGEAALRADRLMYLAKNKKNTVVTEKSAFREMADKSSFFEIKDVKQQILIIDDSDINREILTAFLDSDYTILTAESGEKGLELLEKYGKGISLVLLDLIMPGIDGFEVLTYMNKGNMIEDIPVIVISCEASDLYIRKAYSMGVSDYISRPFDSKVVFQRVFNIIKLYSKQKRLISMLAGQEREKDKNNRMMIDIFSSMVEFRNGESGSHVVRINSITELILDRLMQKTDKYNLSPHDRSLIVTASSLHDIGKMVIDEKIINKPGKLTQEEFEIVKKHTVLGVKILDELKEYRNEKLVEIAIQICHWHHERYDGKGYPDGLKGDEIPISAQVVALADVYDALISKRVYKEAYTHEKAVKMILDGECGVFNPVLIECFKDISGKLKSNVYNS